jgi:hypothetical protein
MATWPELMIRSPGCGFETGVPYWWNCMGARSPTCLPIERSACSTRMVQSWVAPSCARADATSAAPTPLAAVVEEAVVVEAGLMDAEAW